MDDGCHEREAQWAAFMAPEPDLRTLEVRLLRDLADWLDAKDADPTFAQQPPAPPEPRRVAACIPDS